jgi:hypothetical protein
MEDENLQLLSLYMDAQVIVLPQEKAVIRSNAPQIQEENLENEDLALEEVNPLVFVGNFEKKVLIVFEGDELSAETHEFLFKLVSAVNCTVKDVAIFSSQDFERASTSQIEALDAQKIIIFGKVLHELFNFTRNNYEIINREQIDYLFCEDLNSIIGNLATKKILWGKLKNLFNLN